MNRFFLPTSPTGLLGPLSLIEQLLPRVLAHAPARGPALNLWSDADAIHVQAELPGVEESALQLSVLGDELTIAGERANDRPDDVRLHQGERRFGRFERVVKLPGAVDVDAVTAVLKNGLLTIDLPRAAEARARRIPLQDGDAA